MRNLVISMIRSSRKWQACIYNGMEDELPLLENVSDEELLEMYDYYVGGL